MRRPLPSPVRAPAKAALRAALLAGCLGLAVLPTGASGGELTDLTNAAGAAASVRPLPADPVAAALELERGLQIVSGNPLRPSRPELALQRLVELSASTEPDIAKRAEKAWATLVIRRPQSSEADMARAAQIIAAADIFDPDAQIALASAYERGLIPDGAVAVDPEAIYRQALELGRPDAAFGLARLQSDEAAAEDFASQGIFLLRLAAESSSRARMLLAERLAVGDGVDQSLSEARDLFLRLLGEGQFRAYSQLTAMPGLLEDETARAAIRDALARAVVGAGSVEAARLIAVDAVEQRLLGFDEADGQKALTLLTEVADPEGTALAAVALAVGFAGEADPVQAASLMAVFAARPEVSAADLARAGREIAKRTDPRTIAVALAALTGAAGKGDAEAAGIAGRLLIDQSETDQSVDARTAVALLQQAADAGDVRALVTLGDLYASGRFVELSVERALEAYRTAIANGLPMDRHARIARFLIEVAGTDAAIDEGVEILTAAAEAGDMTAIRDLGTLYLRGTRLFAADEAVGLAWLRQAGEAGDGPALVAIGDYLLKEDPGQKSRALAFYEEARTLGYARAVTAIARMMLEDGRRSEAEGLLREAADGGDPDAMVELGRLLIGPDGLPENAAEAEALFERAEAVAGDRATTLLSIGELYAASKDADLKNRGLEILLRLANSGERRAFARIAAVYTQMGSNQANADRAVEWAYRALEVGTTSAVVTVARALVEGDTLPPDTGRAIEMLEDALVREPDSVNMLLILGDIYQKAGPDYRDLSRGFEMFRRAAELGNVRAMTKTAFAYADGAGTERDPKAAYDWFVRGAGSNSAGARVQLAMILSSGVTARIDPEGAAMQLHMAAQNGSVRAKLELGRFLLIGFGVDHDEAAGVEYLVQAAEGGSSEAQFELFQYFRLRGQDGDDKRAFDWLHKAALAGNADAMLRLALVLHFDPKQPAKPEDIVYWLKKSASAGKLPARRALNQYIKAGQIDPAVAEGVDPDEPPPEIRG